MPPANPDPLVSTEWLAGRLNDPAVKIVDATFKMPGVQPPASEDYAREHIPGAVFFDIDGIAGKETSLPHMLPAPEKFAADAGDLGIGDADRIIVYDTNGLGAARVWWTFRVFGHANISVLDGGLRKWKAENRPLTADPAKPCRAQFIARYNTNLVRNRDQILANLDSRREQVVDARAAARFRGEAPEPRPGLRRGHIPGSFNVDHVSLFDPGTGALKPPAEIRGLFEKAGVDLRHPVIATCGSGVTACTLALGLYLLGHKDTAVYDGSWAEWGIPGSLPVETAA